MQLQSQRNWMHLRAFVLFKQAERRIFGIETDATDTCLKKKIHCYRTKVHATVHLFLTFFAIRIMIDDFGRRNSFDHTYHPT